MMFWRDREGKAVNGKEFIQRWKKGIEKVTPVQQTRMAIVGYCIVYLGLFWGIFFTIHLGQWWLCIILIGSTIVTTSQFVTNLQRYVILKRLEDSFKINEQEVENVQENN